MEEPRYSDSRVSQASLADIVSDRLRCISGDTRKKISEKAQLFAFQVSSASTGRVESMRSSNPVLMKRTHRFFPRCIVRAIECCDRRGVRIQFLGQI